MNAQDADSKGLHEGDAVDPAAASAGKSPARKRPARKRANPEAPAAADADAFASEAPAGIAEPHEAGAVNADAQSKAETQVGEAPADSGGSEPGLDSDGAERGPRGPRRGPRARRSQARPDGLGPGAGGPRGPRAFRADGTGDERHSPEAALGTALDLDLTEGVGEQSLANGDLVASNASLEAGAEPAFEAPKDAGELFEQVLAGTFDSETEPAPTGRGGVPDLPEQYKRVLRPHIEAPKLHKVLAQAGVGSRRDLEQMVVQGRIHVNGHAAHTGQRVMFGDRIMVDGKPVRYRIAPPPPRVLAYHKPAGEVVTHDDPQQRPTVFRRLPRLHGAKWQSVGRLDINTEGLLLFCSSGELANQLMHPRFGVEREYAVRSLGLLDEASKEKLLQGVEIDGAPCAFKSIADGGGEGANHWYRVVITEGRNREVRKLFESAGHAVSRLIRIRYGSVVLPRGLRRGIWVELPEHDVRSLRFLAGAAHEAQPAAGDGFAEEADAAAGDISNQDEHSSAGPANAAGPRQGGARRGAQGREGFGQGPRQGGEGPGRQGQGRGAKQRQGQGRQGGRADFAPTGQGQGQGPGQNFGYEQGQGDRPRGGQGYNQGPRQGRSNRSRNAGFGAGNEGFAPDHRLDEAYMDGADERENEAQFLAIPNPLQQTFDRRAIQQAKRQGRELSDDAPIPNPLQQTFDKRAMQRERQPQREYGDDGPIPNPLQQTFDHRFSKGPGSGFGGAEGLPGRPARKGGRPGGSKGFGGNGRRAGPRGAGGPGGGGGGQNGPNGPSAGPGYAGPRGGKRQRPSGPGGGGGQPDPMRTSVGYIGADAALKKPRGGRKGGGFGGGSGGGMGGGQGGRGGR